VLTAVREQRCPVTTTDIRAVATADQDRLVSLSYEVANVTNATPRPAEPVLFVDRLASDVGADDEERRTARQLTVAAQDETLHIGCKPIGVAAGAIAVAAESWINLTELAEAAAISRRTVRTRRQEIREAGLPEQRGEQS
jgi:transcription initiation factor TFIIB